MSLSDLEIVARYLAAPGKGILAADESTGTIGKRLEKMVLTNDEVLFKIYWSLRAVHTYHPKSPQVVLHACRRHASPTVSYC
jgi:hypothetical protein